MTHSQKRTTPDHSLVFKAIAESWCAETSGDPDAWSADNPSWQQCDVSAFVAWEHLGGDVVLGKVFLDGEETEHHYWNRFDGQDIDLTRAQFVDGQEVREVDVLSSSFLSKNRGSIKPEVRARIALLRQRVTDHLDLHGCP